MKNKVVCSLFWFLVNYLTFSLSENGVPVLLWESQSTGDVLHTVPALAEYDRDEFLNHFLKKIKSTHSKPLVLVFLENTLSMEDFSWRDATKKQAFSIIQDMVTNNTEFLPAVQFAEDALQKLEGYGYSQKNIKDLNGAEEGVLSFVRFNDAESYEDRPDMLYRHSKLIEEAVKKVSGSKGNSIFVLTGKEPSWIEPEISLSRMRRAVEAAGGDVNSSNDFFTFNASGQVLLRTAEAPVLTVDGENIPLPAKHEDKLDSRDGVLRLVSTFVDGKKVVLRFKFESQNNNWKLSEVEYNVDGKEGLLLPASEISAPKGSPYLNSSPNIEFASQTKNVTLRLKTLKTQAWTGGSFGQAESQIGFFTVPIWTGILVVGMLSLIMIWGLVMVLDIKTMDQFDDPKGKTISINASD